MCRCIGCWLYAKLRFGCAITTDGTVVALALMPLLSFSYLGYSLSSIVVHLSLVRVLLKALAKEVHVTQLEVRVDIASLCGGFGCFQRLTAYDCIVLE